MKPKFSTMKISKSGLWLKRENQIHLTYEALVLIQLKVKQRKLDQKYTYNRVQNRTLRNATTVSVFVNRNKKMRTLKQDVDFRLCKLRELF